MEKPLYYDQLTALQAVFGDVPTISRAAACKYLKMDVRTVERIKDFPVKRVGRQFRVPLRGLARWLS